MVSSWGLGQPKGYSPSVFINQSMILYPFICWYGLRNIHCLTARESVELRIDLQDEQGNKLTWVYQQFRVDGPDQKYRLHIGQGTGTTGSFDAMAGSYSLNNMYFSTFDRDNEQNGENCAVERREHGGTGAVPTPI